MTYVQQNNRVEVAGSAHPAQVKLIQQAKRFNVVCCGRRWGKTVLGIDRLIHPALKGKPVAWFSATHKLMADTWARIAIHYRPCHTRQVHRFPLKRQHTKGRLSLPASSEGVKRHKGNCPELR